MLGGYSECMKWYFLYFLSGIFQLKLLKFFKRALLWCILFLINYLELIYEEAPLDCKNLPG